jgi:hypothetical protein
MCIRNRLSTLGRQLGKQISPEPRLCQVLEPSIGQFDRFEFACVALVYLRR